MKTTVELPDGLVREIKMRAVSRRQKLKDTVAELLQKGLAASDAEAAAPAVRVRRDRQTGLPVVECLHAAAPGEELTPDRAADILLAQEAGWLHGTGR
ncbi:MAG TPA: hypothetical protein VKD90_05690 [Gemmataceae bacterium]|nr:hypothetical protein [Gemmataceae bacterium]